MKFRVKALLNWGEFYKRNSLEKIILSFTSLSIENEAPNIINFPHHNRLIHNFLFLPSLF